MDTEMDLDLDAPAADFDIALPETDLDFAEPFAPTSSQIVHPDSSHDALPAIANGADSASGEPVEPVLTKIHLRGLDDFTTKDIRTWADQSSNQHKPKVEWIDDTSANLCFETAEIAAEALTSYSLTTLPDLATLDPLQLRPAQASPTRPDASLQIRLAVTTDRKKPRAHEASRFYMMHPEHDPREQRRRNGDDGRSRRRQNDRRRRRSDESDPPEKFSASMYDDDADALAERAAQSRSARSSMSSASGALGSYRISRRGPSRHDSRNRSASPGRATNGRSRRRTPPPAYSRRDPDPVEPANLGKELFPTKGQATRGLAGNSAKELLPGRNGMNGTHATADETADLFSSRIRVPLVDGAADTAAGTRAGDDGDAFPLHSDALRRPARKMASDASGSRGLSIKGAAEREGFGISGAAADRDTSGGFVIRGSAAATEAKVRELFPDRVNNKGKELFGGTAAPRGQGRKKADAFY